MKHVLHGRELCEFKGNEGYRPFSFFVRLSFEGNMFQ